MNVKAAASAMTLPGGSRTQGDDGRCIRRPTTMPTSSMLRPSKQQPQHSTVQLPAPLQRPHYKIPVPPPTHKPKETETKKKRASAADVLRVMDSLQLPVDAETYDSLIKECTFTRDAVEGARVHAHIKKTMKRKKTSSSRRQLVGLASRQMLMYVAGDCVDTARQVFDQMLIRNAGSWATVISALAHADGHREALGLFADMLRTHSRGWSDLALESADTLVLLVKIVLGSCVQAGKLGLGKQVHALSAKMAVSAMLIAPLLEFYAAFGCLECAQEVFDSMAPSSCDAAMRAYTSLVFACCRQCQFQEAFHVFGEMFNAVGLHNNTKKPDRKSISTAFASILSACARTKKRDEGILCGRQVHASAIKIGLDSDLYVGTSLVNMYGRFGFLGEARRAFAAVCSSSNAKDVTCWSAMLRSYLRNGYCAEAVKLLYEMKSAGVEPLECIVSSKDGLRKLMILVWNKGKNMRQIYDSCTKVSASIHQS